MDFVPTDVNERIGIGVVIATLILLGIYITIDKAI